MVLLVDRFYEFYSRLEDDRRRHDRRLPRDFSVFLRDFESDVSDIFRQLPGNTNFFSFQRIHRLLLVIPEMNKAFAKLVVKLEHPIGEWKSDCVDEYLNYTMSLLELLNSITSSVSHLSRERILISYALMRAPTSPSSARGRLKPIQRKKFINNLKKRERKGTEKERKKNKPTKDSTIRQALRVLQGVGLWICGISVTGLLGDENPYCQLRKSAMEIQMDALNRIDSEINKEGSEKKWVVDEIRGLNEAVGRLIGAIDDGKSGEAEKEVDREVGEFEKQLEGIEKVVNRLFSEILAERTQIACRLAMAEEEEEEEEKKKRW